MEPGKSPCLSKKKLCMINSKFQELQVLVLSQYVYDVLGVQQRFWIQLDLSLVCIFGGRILLMLYDIVCPFVGASFFFFFAQKSYVF